MRNRPVYERPWVREAAEGLARATDMPLSIAAMLWRRGVRTPADVYALLDPPPLSDPFQLPEMAEAVERLRQAVSRGERVRVYGDYDADGMTATALLVRGLRAAFSDLAVDYALPNRFEDGYGLPVEGVRQAYRDGVTVLVTVDCGSTAFDAAEMARQLGVSLIVTDHHALATRLPPALVLNPQRLSPAPTWSGAGVALQLLRALLGEELPEACWALAALGTLADVVPLLGDNRYLVRRGLAAVAAQAVPGINTLLKGREVTTENLAFTVIPCLNAAGRMEDPAPAVELLLEEQPERCSPLVKHLEALNDARRAAEQAVREQAIAQLAESPLTPFVVVAQEGWHVGVLGLVAGRLKDLLARPVAVISWDGQGGRGSARGVDGVDLIAVLRQHQDRFWSLGGHAGAAGFTLPRQAVSELQQVLSAALPPSAQASGYLGLEVDGFLDAEACDPAWQAWLRRLEPYGHAFPRPRWVIRGTISGLRRFGQGRHARWRVNRHGLQAVCFGLGPDALQEGQGIFALGSLEWERWQGEERARLRVHRVSGAAVGTVAVRPGPVPEFQTGTRVIWVVDDGRSVRRLAVRWGAAAYDWNRPIGELRLLEARAERGWVERLVVNQWRPLPELFGWADHLVYVGVPASSRHLAEACALLREGGTVWVGGDGYAARTYVLRKWTRLRLDRQRLGRLWRRLREGQRPLLPGRAVFAELSLDPLSPVSPGRRNLEESSGFRWNAEAVDAALAEWQGGRGAPIPDSAANLPRMR